MPEHNAASLALLAKTIEVQMLEVLLRIEELLKKQDQRATADKFFDGTKRKGK